MPTASLSSADIYYETMGDPAGEPLIMVMGFTAQMHYWPDGFCQELVDQGFFLVRFDNRDVGLSSKTEGTPPNGAELAMRAAMGEDVSGEVPYSLSDMAGDVVELADELGLATFHLVGASMGGMIVQTLAFEHADRVRSATSIMSTTGDPSVGGSSDETLQLLLTPPPTEREASLDLSMRVARAISGPLFDKGEALARITKAYDRCNHPIGGAFQLAAMAASGNRTEQLATIDLPFLVIHGLVDELIGVSGGHATADVVPNADLLVLAQMGHDLPPLYWPQLAGAIKGLSSRG